MSSAEIFPRKFLSPLFHGCAIAIYAFGTGWALIPIGFALLIFQRAHTTGGGRGALVLWSLLTLLLVWHFFRALNDTAASYTTASIPNLFDIKTWLGLAHYALNFVASPIVRFARDSSLVAMAIGFAILIWSLWTLKAAQKGPIGQATAPILALAAFSLGSGLLTAIGRWESFGVQHAFVSRYISFGSFFWIAVFVLAVFAIAKTSHKTHKRTFAVLSLLFVMKLGNIPSVVQKSVKISNQVSLASQQLVIAYPEVPPETYAVLHNPLQTIEPQLDLLFEHKASLFLSVPDAEDSEPLP